MAELTPGLAEYVTFYNGECPHQSLGNRTPKAVYAEAMVMEAGRVSQTISVTRGIIALHTLSNAVPRRLK